MQIGYTVSISKVGCAVRCIMQEQGLCTSFGWTHKQGELGSLNVSVTMVPWLAIGAAAEHACIPKFDIAHQSH